MALNFGKLSKRTRSLVIVFIALLFSGAIVFALFRTFAGSGTGIAYNWKEGTSPTYYGKVSNMPEGWDFVTFSSTLVNNKVESFGIWVPMATPMIGSRDLQISDSGDDVKALQIALNAVRTTDDTDEYYFDKVPTDGTYDQITTNAVYTLQGFFDQELTGAADLNFQSSLYRLVTTAQK